MVSQGRNCPIATPIAKTKIETCAVILNIP